TGHHRRIGDSRRRRADAARHRHPEDATLKGDARMAELLHRALWRNLRSTPGALVMPRGARRWRVPAHEVDDAVTPLRQRPDGYTTLRSLLPHRLAQHGADPDGARRRDH